MNLAKNPRVRCSDGIRFLIRSARRPRPANQQAQHQPDHTDGFAVLFHPTLPEGQRLSGFELFLSCRAVQPFCEATFAAPLRRTAPWNRFHPPPSFCASRRLLAIRAEKTAPPRHHYPANKRLASVTSLPFPAVGFMVKLILSRLSLDVKKVGNRRSAQHNRSFQDLLQRKMQCLDLFNR